MKILFLADPIDNQTAGVHQYTKNLISALLKIDKKNDYIFIHRQENDFFKNTKHKIISGKKFPGSESLRKFIKIPLYIRKIKPDIVIEPAHIGPFNLPKSILRGVIIHDLTPILFPQFHIHQSVRTHKLLLPHILKNADIIFTPSENTKKDIQNFQKVAAPIVPIFAGYPQTYLSDKISKAPRPLPIPYLLYLGTIEPRKNLLTLINAYKKIRPQYPNLKLVFIGKVGWKSQEIIESANKNDIIIQNFVDENQKKSWLQNAEILIYPSYYEGFGLPPLEAAALHIPIICAKTSSLTEIYKNTATFFNPNSTNDLAKKIAKLLSSPEKKSALAKKYATLLKNFTWENTAKKFLAGLKTLHPNQPTTRSTSSKNR